MKFFIIDYCLSHQYNGIILGGLNHQGFFKARVRGISYAISISIIVGIFNELMKQRLLKDTKESGNLWAELSRQKLIQFHDRETNHLELTREEQKMIYFVYLLYCRERGIVPSPREGRRNKREIAGIYTSPLLR
jgi:hypothetical protein